MATAGFGAFQTRRSRVAGDEPCSQGAIRVGDKFVQSAWGVTQEIQRATGSVRRTVLAQGQSCRECARTGAGRWRAKELTKSFSLRPGKSTLQLHRRNTEVSWLNWA